MYARYHNHGESKASGVAEVSKSDVSEGVPVIPRGVHRKELLVNHFLAKSLTCPLCSDILADVQSASCGHTFCSACLSGEDVSTCPLCEKEIIRERISKNTQLQTLVNDLPVQCPSNVSYNCSSEAYERVPGGCGWEGRNEDLSAHVADCSHQSVACPGAPQGCTVVVWKWGLPAHMRNCSFSTQCECGASLAVRDFEKHRQTGCTKALVSCPHERLGCPVRVARPDLPKHLQACDYQKVLPAFARLEAAHAAEIVRLKQECEVAVAGHKAYLEQEILRLRKQLLACQAGGKSGKELKDLGRGGIARKAQALGLQAGTVLEKRKRGPYAPRKGSAKTRGVNGGAKVNGVPEGAVSALPKPVDPTQFVQLPQDSVFQFDQFQAAVRAPEVGQSQPHQTETGSTPPLSSAQNTPTSEAPPSSSVPASTSAPSSTSGTPPAASALPTGSLPLFKFPASSKPGYKKCPFTEACNKSLPHNASSCPACGGSGQKREPKIPPPAEQQCGSCKAMNPKSFVTCVRCSAYLPREYSTNRCPSCGRGNNGNARMCGACGAELRPKRTAQYTGNTCPNCAKGNNANARKCKTCGHELRAATLVGRLKA